MSTGSEYGGQAGMIQPNTTDISDGGNASSTHPLTVNEQLMVSGRAMAKERGGVVKDVVLDAKGNQVGTVPYDEAQAEEDLRTGNNY